MKKLITILIILAVLIGGAYIWFLMRTPGATTPTEEPSTDTDEPVDNEEEDDNATDKKES